MDPPADDTNLKPETLEEEKESGPLFQCDFFDMDMVYKIGQSLLPGLASACIDNTIGGLFKTPASVAVDLRREMVDYLTQRSETFMAESVVLEGGPEVDISVDPYDTISDFVDDFVSSKRNFVSRVSGWIMSEKREDWIDDLVQEMELNGFWLSNQRNSVGQNLLKNLDFKNTYHCNMSFRISEDLEKHKLCCGFRTMSCESEGCDASFSAAQLDHHDSVCLFKILPCEQNCGDSIMRREMDRHCITVCPMKLVKCPFHSMGCHNTIPQSTIGKHRMDSVYDHLLYILQAFHKDASLKDLKERVKELEKLSSLEELASTRDARSLTNVVKRLEARLGPLKVSTEEKPNEEDTDLIGDKQEEKASSPKKHIERENPLTEKEDETVNSHYNVSDNQLVESSSNSSSHSQSSGEKMVESGSVQEENLKGSPVDLGSPSKNVGGQMETLLKEEDLNESPFEKKEEISSPTEKDDVQIEENKKESLVDLGSPTKNVGGQMETLLKEENLNESPFEKKEEISSPTEKVDVQIENLSREVLEEVPIEKKEYLGVELGSPTKNVGGEMETMSKEENSNESPFENKEDISSPIEKVGVQIEDSPKEEVLEEVPIEKKEDLGSPIKNVDEQMENLLEEENSKEQMENLLEEENSKESPFDIKEVLRSPTKNVDEHMEELRSPTKDVDEHMEELSREGNLIGSPHENKEGDLGSPTKTNDELIETLSREELPFEKEEGDSNDSQFKKKEED